MLPMERAAAPDPTLSRITAEEVAALHPGLREVIYIAAPTASMMAQTRGFFRSMLGMFSGTLAPPRVPIEHAQSVFSFCGHYPLPDTLYVLDPFDRSYRNYLRAVDAATHVTKAKIGHFHRLAAALGARRIEIVQATAQNQLIDASVVAQIVGHDLGFQWRSAGDSGQQTRMVSELGPPSHQPYVPEDLQHLVQHDPQWRALYEASLSNMTSHTLVIDNQHAVQISARLKGLEALLPDASVGAGLKFTENDRWSFHVSFAPPQSVIQSAPPTHRYPAAHQAHAAPSQAHAAHGWSAPSGHAHHGVQAASSYSAPPQTASLGFCGHCGQRVVAATRYCAHCGQSLDSGR